jgi:hypothetical protein
VRLLSGSSSWPCRWLARLRPPERLHCPTQENGGNRARLHSPHVLKGRAVCCQRRIPSARSDRARPKCVQTRDPDRRPDGQRCVAGGTKAGARGSRADPRPFIFPQPDLDLHGRSNLSHHRGPVLRRRGAACNLARHKNTACGSSRTLVTRFASRPMPTLALSYNRLTRTRVCFRSNLELCR